MSHLLVLNHSVFQKQTIRCEVGHSSMLEPDVMNIVKRDDVFKKEM